MHSGYHVKIGSIVAGEGAWGHLVTRNFWLSKNCRKILSENFRPKMQKLELKTQFGGNYGAVLKF